MRGLLLDVTSLWFLHLQFLFFVTEISRRKISSSNTLNDDIKRRLQSLAFHSNCSPLSKFVCIISCGGPGVNWVDRNEATVFINEIIKGLQKRAINTLRYDLVTDTETRIQHLNTFYGVFILFFSKDYASAESLDKLVTLMEYQKANGILIIPIFFKVTPSEVRDLKGIVKETFSQLDNSDQAGQVQKWREAINELTQTDDCKWIVG